METTNNNTSSNNHQEKAGKLKKARNWKFVASAVGVAILAAGVIQTAIMFLDYKRTETSNDAQIEQYLSPIWGIERSGFFNGRGKWAKGFENQRV